MKKSVFVKIFIIMIVLIAMLAIMTSCFLFKSDKDKDTEDKVELTADMIQVYGTYVYSGEPQTIENNSFHIEVNGHYVNAANFDKTYENNIEVGTATVTLTAKDDAPYVYGSATVTFEIVPYYLSKYANNYEEFVSLASDIRYSRIEVNFELVIPEGDTIVVSENKNINLTYIKGDQFNTNGLFKNYGTLTIGAGSTVALGGSRDYSSVLYNYGAINGDGIFSLYSNSACYNSGEINVKDPIKTYGGLYSNQELNVEKMGNGKYIKRQQIDSSIVTTNLEDNKVKFNSNVNYNKATIYLNGMYYGSVTYSNYDKVGTASYTIKALDDDRNYYGSLSGTYEITKGDVEFGTYEKFVEYKTSGNYANYTQSVSSVTFSDDVTIDADETLTLRNATFSKALTNNGIINPSNSITVMGELSNQGTINASSTNFNTLSTNADVYNGSGDNNNAAIHMALSNGRGTLYNFGTVSLDDGYSISLDICNYRTGIISMNKANGYLLLYGDVQNYGTITSLSNTVFSRSLNNTNTGYIEFAGDGRMDKYDDNTFYNNMGRIVNKGRFAFADGIAINNNTNFDNSNGTVYGFDPSLNISENFVLRSYLNTHTFALSITDVDYDGNPHQATATLDENDIDTNLFSLSKQRSGAATTDFTSVGTITYLLTAKGSYNQYAGNVFATYDINLGTITVTSGNELYSNLSNQNWGTINLGANINYTAPNSLAIGYNQELHTNGYQLKVSNAGITINGALYVEEVGSTVTEENIGLYFINTSTISSATHQIYLYGSIVNSGLIAFGEKQVNIQYYGSGRFYNSGTIYAGQWLSIPSHTTGTGAVIERVSLTACTVKFPGNVTTYNVDYNGSEITPTLSLYDGSTLLDNSDYSITYANNVNAGTASVTISNSNIFNERFYGSRTVTFNINRIIKELHTGTIAQTDFDGSENYYKYKLLCNASIYSDITIPADTILDLGPYRINTKPVSNQYTISVEDGASVYMDVDTYADLTKYWRLVTKFTLTTDIASTESDKEWGLYYYENHKSSVTGWLRYGGYNLTIDLNGHTLDAHVIIQNSSVDASYTTINLSIVSTGAKGTIGDSAYTNYALKQTTPGTPPHGKMNITLSNLTVYGFQFDGNINGSADEKTTIIVSNCDFIGVGTKSAIYAGRIGRQECITERLDATFNNCRFNATQAAAAIVNSGTITFNTCAFTSTGTRSASEPYCGNGIVALQKANASDRLVKINVNNSQIHANPTDGYGIFYKDATNIAGATVRVVVNTNDVTYYAAYDKNI